MRYLFLISFLFLTSCTKFLQLTDDGYYDQIDASGKNKELKILFSNNINGETHPCGCRQHPLGGLVQVAGWMHKLRQDHPVLYVDTGDTFFISATIAESADKSTEHTTQALADALTKLKINLYVPGDQDFARGEDYLAKLLKKHDIQVVVSNFGNTRIQHKKWVNFKYGDHVIFFLGIISPQTFYASQAPELRDPQKALAESLAEIEKKYANEKNKKFILLSHSGIDYDEIIAEKFPQLDWIIGSHSQSFTNSPVTVGKTKLVQALSRNHYLGEITIPASAKQESKFELIEIADEKSQWLPDSKWKDWLTNYKSELEKIQMKEQGFFTSNNIVSKYSTYKSCKECHNKQSEFWESTAHALAYVTLVNAKAAHNSQCIDCHSLGFKKEEGFATTNQIFHTEKAPLTKQQNDKYLQEFTKLTAKLGSIRELSAEKRKKISQKWQQIDEKFEVAHNFANVQCLHCHTKGADHPFDVDPKTTVSMEQKCMNCHTKDQSPEWYEKDSKGLATTLNRTYFATVLKKVACPANDGE